MINVNLKNPFRRQSDIALFLQDRSFFGWGKANFLLPLSFNS